MSQRRPLHRIDIWLSIALVAFAAGWVAKSVADGRARRQRSFALVDAIRTEDAARVKALLRAGADLGPLDEKSESAIRVAYGRRDGGEGARKLEIAMLEEVARVGIPVREDFACVALAVRSGRLDLLRRVLARNPIGPLGTAIWDAIARDRRDMVLVLLDYYGVDAARGNGQLLVHHAVLAGSPAMVALILDRLGNAEANRRSTGINSATGVAAVTTPLMLPIRGTRSTEVLRLLLDRGADPNALDNTGGTPLTMKAGWGPAEHVRLLLSRGADPNLRDGDGRTPLGVARARHRKEIIALLKRAGARR